MNHEHRDMQHDTSSRSKEGNNDVERQSAHGPADLAAPKESAFKGLGWLDRLLALWILLAMIVGILLGNFVDSVGPALHKGEFVGVSIPIGRHRSRISWQRVHANTSASDRSACYDVSHSLQSTIRNTTYRV